MYIHKRGDCNRYMSQHTSCVQCKQSGVHVTVYNGAVLIHYNKNNKNIFNKNEKDVGTSKPKKHANKFGRLM